jgi:hypothetical protein
MLKNRYNVITLVCTLQVHRPIQDIQHTVLSLVLGQDSSTGLSGSHRHLQPILGICRQIHLNGYRGIFDERMELRVVRQRHGVGDEVARDPVHEISRRIKLCGRLPAR